MATHDNTTPDKAIRCALLVTLCLNKDLVREPCPVSGVLVQVFPDSVVRVGKLIDGP